MKKARILASAMALAMCFSAMPMSAFAAQDENQNLTENAAPNVEVEIITNSQYEVQIPKKLTISNLEATQNAEISYTYKVKGSIAGNEELQVIPDATVTMMQKGKEDNIGTITQEKQIWSCADFEALNGANAAEIVWSDAQIGNVLVNNMSAGTWNGTFNFNIELVRPHTGVYFDVQYKDSSSAFGYDLVFNPNGTVIMYSLGGSGETIELSDFVYEDDAIFDSTGEKWFEIYDNGKTIFSTQFSIYFTVDEGSLT